MRRHYFIYAPLLFICGAAAQAADTKLLVGTEQTSFSDSYGKRRETTAESTTDFGATAFTFSASYGKRETDKESFSAMRLAGTVHHDWNDRFFTRTSIAVSQNKPVFANREAVQEFNFKPVRNAVLTVGGRYARYLDDREALSWSAGGSYYFAGGFATYRYSSYDVTKLGKSHGHLATFRIKDGKGSTQLWLGAGTSLHEQLQFPVASQGNFRSVAIHRVQPLKGPIGVRVGLGRTWYETGSGRYHGTTLTVGLSVSELPKL